MGNPVKSGFPWQEGKDGSWLSPFATKGGDGMSDYEILAIVIIMITLVFSVHINSGKNKG